MVYKDGQHDSSQNMKPKHQLPPGGLSIGHKPFLRQNVKQIIQKMLSSFIILGSYVVKQMYIQVFKFGFNLMLVKWVETS